MLSHILYGQAALTHGGLIFKAQAAGARGQQVSLTIESGDELAVTITFPASNIFEIVGSGAGAILLTVADDTTEADVIDLLNADASFKILATVESAEDADSTDNVETRAATPFSAPTDGLQQHLQAKLGIANWESRTLVATGAPLGDIWTGDAKPTRIELDGSPDYWEGSVFVGVGFQHEQRYQVQNALLDACRRALVAAINDFDHEDVIDKTEIICGYTNQMKDKSAGTADDKGELSVIAHIKMQWQEPSLINDDSVPFEAANIGLWREPQAGDVTVVGDGEVFDQTLTITPE